MKEGWNQGRKRRTLWHERSAKRVVTQLTIDRKRLWSEQFKYFPLTIGFWRWKINTERSTDTRFRECQNKAFRMGRLQKLWRDEQKMGEKGNEEQKGLWKTVDTRNGWVNLVSLIFTWRNIFCEKEGNVKRNQLSRQSSTFVSRICLSHSLLVFNQLHPSPSVWDSASFLQNLLFLDWFSACISACRLARDEWSARWIYLPNLSTHPVWQWIKYKEYFWIRTQETCLFLADPFIQK